MREIAKLQIAAGWKRPSRACRAPRPCRCSKPPRVAAACGSPVLSRRQAATGCSSRDSLEDHTVGFRNSQAFADWRALVGPFFAAPPEVEHGAPLALGF